FEIVDGDLLLGRGVALVRTPGHTVGNWSLVLHTETGLWAVSENGVACDAYAPRASGIGGVKRTAGAAGEEAQLNHETPVGPHEQYTSMLLERLLVDRCQANPEFYQHFPSSELVSSPLAPGLSPTYRHGAITSGQPRRALAGGHTEAA